VTHEIGQSATSGLVRPLPYRAADGPVLSSRLPVYGP